MSIVVDPPCFDLAARILDRYELRDVQTLVARTIRQDLRACYRCRSKALDWPSIISPPRTAKNWRKNNKPPNQSNNKTNECADRNDPEHPK
jgi:hypothetical protein